MDGLSTTGVESEEGQSIFEFLLMLPVLVGLTVILIRINSAIQVSIVNQKYGRAQALFLAFNHANYPRLEQKQKLAETSSNQMVLGVSDNVAPNDNQDYVPKATVQMIARTRRVQGSEAPREEPNLRSNVRIRNTVTLCTPVLWVPTGNATGGGTTGVPVIPVGGTPLRVLGRTALNEGTRFNNICRSSMKYE
jgi:hypothetical protein